MNSGLGRPQGWEGEWDDNWDEAEKERRGRAALESGTWKPSPATDGNLYAGITSMGNDPNEADQIKSKSLSIRNLRMNTVSDPYLRRLYDISANARANAGEDNIFNDLPDVEVPDTFETGQGIRESILAGTQAQFDRNMQAVQENAIRKGRLQSGVTSNEELRAVEASRLEAIGKIGEFESQERSALRDYALAQTTMASRLKEIRTTGEEERLTQTGRYEGEKGLVEASGKETRLNIGETGKEERLTQTERYTGEAGLITKTGEETRKTQTEVSAQRLAEIEKSAAEGRITQEEAARQRLTEITRQGEANQALAMTEGAQQVKAIEAQGKETRAVRSLELTQEAALRREELTGVVAGGSISVRDFLANMGLPVESTSLTNAISLASSHGLQYDAISNSFVNPIEARLTIAAKAQIQSAKEFEDSLKVQKTQLDNQKLEIENQLKIAKLDSDTRVKLQEMQAKNASAIALIESADRKTALEIERKRVENELTSVREQISAQERLAVKDEDLQLRLASQSASLQKELAQLDASVKREEITANKEIQNRFATVEERKAAIAENDSVAQIAIAQATLAMQQKAEKFNETVTKSQMTGIWQAYGQEEMTEFKTSFNSETGDPNYNAVYDFDSDGKIDFKDFVKFAEYAKDGGIPTQAAKEFRESVRQFDLTSTEQSSQFQEQLKETARQFNLSSAQEWTMAINALEANQAIQEADVDVRMAANMISLATAPSVELSSDQLGDILDFVMGVEFTRAQLSPTFDLSSSPGKAPGVSPVQQASWDSVMNKKRGEAGYDPQFDLDKDGTITQSDFMAFAKTQGTPKVSASGAADTDTGVRPLVSRDEAGVEAASEEMNMRRTDWQNTALSPAQMYPDLTIAVTPELSRLKQDVNTAYTELEAIRSTINTYCTTERNKGLSDRDIEKQAQAIQYEEQFDEKYNKWHDAHEKYYQSLPQEEQARIRSTMSKSPPPKKPAITPVSAPLTEKHKAGVAFVKQQLSDPSVLASMGGNTSPLAFFTKIGEIIPKLPESMRRAYLDKMDLNEDGVVDTLDATRYALFSGGV